MPMNDFLIYLLKVSLITNILYGLYWLMFRKTTFHTINRLLLLFIIIFSFICPELAFNSTLNQPINDYSLWVNNFGDFSTEVPGSIQQYSNDRNLLSLSNAFFIIYFIGMVLFFIRFTYQIWLIIKMRSNALRAQRGNQLVYLTDHKRTPFSFFGWIFLPFNNDNTDNLILEHEKVHAKQFHSLDIIVAELFCVAFWFNPLVFVLKNSLKTVHEYLADNKVIQNGKSIPDYLKLLIANIEMKRLSGITNNFNCINIKKRIEMITKSKSSNIRKLTYLFLLPVIGLMMQSFANHPGDENKPSIVPIQIGSAYRISSGFGMRMHPIFKEKKMHNGVDIPAKKGTPVLASADGLVVSVKFNKSRGRWIIIKHNETYSSSYSQLSEFNVVEGESIKQGDVIGYVGSSGLSTAPHLHYEVLKNGAYVDPEKYFE